MSPTPNLQDLVKSVRDEVPDNDPLGQLTKAAELSAELSSLGDRLLDHFVFQCRQAGMSWAELSAALGVSKQAAHKRFTGTTPNFQRYTVKARDVIQGSINQARSLGHDTVGTEHLLVAIFTPADSLAAIALNRLGVRQQDVLERLLAREPGEPDQPTGPIPFDDEAKGVLRSAVDEAINLGHNYIGTEHLLLALARQPGYASAQILGALGQDVESVQSTLLEELERFTHERANLQHLAE
jgi:ATP-dependent Clp protease ATP-binding subunit ClpA